MFFCDWQVKAQLFLRGATRRHQNTSPLAFLLLLEHHLEEAFLLLMPFEVVFILLSTVLTVVALEVGTVTLDIVEYVLVLAEELGGVGFEQFYEFGYL